MDGDAQTPGRKPRRQRITPGLIEVLRYMVDHGGSAYAYAIMTTSRTRSGVIPGILRRLRDRGWTTTRTVDPIRGGARVVHTLTTEGERRAGEILAAHRQEEVGDSRAA